MDQAAAPDRAPVHFVAVVEPGDLERKCVLLLESLRAFGGGLADSPCWFVRPTRGAALSRRTRRIFFDLDARLVACELNRAWPHYPIANKIVAAAFIERLLPDGDTVLCFLDSDVVCLRPPDALRLDPRVDVALVPVDVIGRGQRTSSPLTDYWQRVFALCGVEPERAWPVRTNVERTEILAYFNAGMVAARRRSELFGRWLAALGRARGAGPFEGRQLRNLDQALLAGVVLGQLERERVAILGAEYNYPLHLHRRLPRETAVGSTEAIVLAHYHGLFYRRGCLRELPFADSHRRWLAPRLPIETVWQRQLRRLRKRL